MTEHVLSFTSEIKFLSEESCYLFIIIIIILFKWPNLTDDSNFVMVLCCKI